MNQATNMEAANQAISNAGRTAEWGRITGIPNFTEMKTTPLTAPNTNGVMSTDGGVYQVKVNGDNKKYILKVDKAGDGTSVIQTLSDSNGNVMTRIIPMNNGVAGTPTPWSHYVFHDPIVPSDLNRYEKTAIINLDTHRSGRIIPGVPTSVNRKNFGAGNGIAMYGPSTNAQILIFGGTDNFIRSSGGTTRLPMQDHRILTDTWLRETYPNLDSVLNGTAVNSDLTALQARIEKIDTKVNSLPLSGVIDDRFSKVYTKQEIDNLISPLVRSNELTAIQNQISSLGNPTTTLTPKITEAGKTAEWSKITGKPDLSGSKPNPIVVTDVNGTLTTEVGNHQVKLPNGDRLSLEVMHSGDKTKLYQRLTYPNGDVKIRVITMSNGRATSTPVWTSQFTVDGRQLIRNLNTHTGNGVYMTSTSIGGTPTVGTPPQTASTIPATGWDGTVLQLDNDQQRTQLIFYGETEHYIRINDNPPSGAWENHRILTDTYFARKYPNFDAILSGRAGSGSSNNAGSQVSAAQLNALKTEINNTTTTKLGSYVPLNRIQSNDTDTNNDKLPRYFADGHIYSKHYIGTTLALGTGDVRGAKTGYVTLKFEGGILQIDRPVRATDLDLLSDAKFKRDIRPIEQPLEKIKQLEGRRYHNTLVDKEALGFIAQEVEKVLPELVNTAADHKSVAYIQFIPLLLEGMKALMKQNEDLLKRVNQLEENYGKTTINS